MARTTKQLSGAAKDKLLRGLVAAVDGLPSSDARRVSESLSDALTDVRVRRDVWEAVRRGPVSSETPAPALPASTPRSDVVAAPAPVTQPTPPSAPPTAAFDPYAFSAVALLTRKGRGALVAAFDAIERLDDLRALALAQHLALDPSLDDPEAVRAALVASTERRIAERKAAAS